MNRIEDIMRICAILVALFFAATPVSADQTTNNANLGEAPTCQKITLSVAQAITPGGTTTNLFYQLMDCAGAIVAQGNAAIPASAYTVQNKSTHRLKTTTPAGSTGLQGTIDVTWSATTANQTTFSGTTTTRQGQTLTRTTEDQFFSSASVSGSVIGWSASGYPGSIGTQSQVGK